MIPWSERNTTSIAISHLWCIYPFSYLNYPRIPSNNLPIGHKEVEHIGHFEDIPTLDTESVEHSPIAYNVDMVYHIPKFQVVGCCSLVRQNQWSLWGSSLITKSTWFVEVT